MFEKREERPREPTERVVPETDSITCRGHAEVLGWEVEEVTMTIYACGPSGWAPVRIRGPIEVPEDVPGVLREAAQEEFEANPDADWIGWTWEALCDKTNASLGVHHMGLTEDELREKHGRRA